MTRKHKSFFIYFSPYRIFFIVVILGFSADYMTGKNDCVAFRLGSFNVGILVETFANVTSQVSVNVGVSGLVFGVIVTAGSFVPMMCFVGSPIGIERMLASVIANVTEAVLVFIGVRSKSFRYVVIATGSVPVIVFVVRPLQVKVVIAELICANVTNTVVIFVGVGVKSEIAFSVVRTGGSVPVVSVVRYPGFRIQGVSADLVCANVTNAVVVFVFVSIKVSFYDLAVINVTAGSFAPMTRGVVFPRGAEARMLAELILAFVANAVVVCIAFGVKLFVLNENSVTAGCCVPMLFCSDGPFVVVCMYVVGFFTANGTVSVYIEVVIKNLVLCRGVIASGLMPMSRLVTDPLRL